jgi:hypothetical protein
VSCGTGEALTGRFCNMAAPIPIPVRYKKSFLFKALKY